MPGPSSSTCSVQRAAAIGDLQAQTGAFAVLDCVLDQVHDSTAQDDRITDDGDGRAALQRYVVAETA